MLYPNTQRREGTAVNDAKKKQAKPSQPGPRHLSPRLGYTAANVSPTLETTLTHAQISAGAADAQGAVAAGNGEYGVDAADGQDGVDGGHRAERVGGQERKDAVRR